MAFNVIKIAGLAAGALGLGSTLVSGWVNDRKMEEKIEEKVREVLAEREENDEEEEEES